MPLSPDSNTDTLGLVVAAFGLGQMVASPFFGAWANLRKSCREPLLICVALSCLASMFYSYLASLSDHRVVFFILSRCLLGLSTGSNPVTRSYISAATTEKERTAAMANVNIYCSFAFIVGPVLQSVMVLISYPGPVESVALHINMYTLPAHVAALFSFINVLIMLCFFREHRLYGHKEEGNHTVQKDIGQTAPKPDRLAIVTCLLTYFVIMFMFTSNRTMNTPLSMHMFAWSKARATFLISVLTCVLSAQAIGVYIIVKWLAQRIKERSLLLGAIILSSMSFFALVPWGDKLPPLGFAPVIDTTDHNVTNPSFLFASTNHSILPKTPALSTDWTTTTIVTPNVTSTAEPEGCPWHYPWCRTQPGVNLAQFIVSAVLYGVALPSTHVLIFTIFSKVLGPIPQGLWMGVFAAVGSLAAMVGPVTITVLYDTHGPRWAFSTVSGVLAVCAVGLLTVFHRLKPYTLPPRITHH